MKLLSIVNYPLDHRRTYEPFGHTHIPKGFECPVCKKVYAAAGGSCGKCADNGHFVLIVEVY